MDTENMNPEDIFHKAIEIADGFVRAAYLDKICKGNERLREEVEELLQAHEQAGDFLEPSVIEPGVTLDSSPGTDWGRWHGSGLSGRAERACKTQGCT